ncbi:hypothetical protein BDP27DRAFT_1331099, partial [Rhodocollybia butyracea]
FGRTNPNDNIIFDELPCAQFLSLHYEELCATGLVKGVQGLVNRGLFSREVREHLFLRIRAQLLADSDSLITSSITASDICGLIELAVVSKVMSLLHAPLCNQSAHPVPTSVEQQLYAPTHILSPSGFNALDTFYPDCISALDMLFPPPQDVDTDK